MRRQLKLLEPQARPFLKWAGGKRVLAPRILARLPRPLPGYHEPFLGGGAVFFALCAAGRRPRRVVLSDANERLLRAWRAVRDRVDELLARLREHEAAHLRDPEGYYYATRALDIDDADDVEVGAWLIYLNKTAFNGLYRVNRRGRFNVPLGRYARPTICDEPNLRAVHALLQGVELRREDFSAVLERARPGEAVYFDPPYVPLSRTASFTAYTDAAFGPGDQRRLRDLALELAGRGVRVLLSNHDHPEVRDLYRPELGFRLERVEVPRAINSRADRRGAVGELLIAAGGGPECPAGR